MSDSLSVSMAPAARLVVALAAVASSSAAAPVSPGGGLAGLLAGSSAATTAVSAPLAPSASSPVSISANTQEARALVNEATGGEFAEGTGGVITTLGLLRVETPSQSCGTQETSAALAASSALTPRPGQPAASGDCDASGKPFASPDGEARDPTGAILATWPF